MAKMEVTVEDVVDMSKFMRLLQSYLVGDSRSTPNWEVNNVIALQLTRIRELLTKLEEFSPPEWDRDYD